MGATGRRLVQDCRVMWIDYILLLVIVISTLLSLWRGFVTEAISLLSWIVALWIAVVFFQDLSHLIQDWIATPAIRDVTAFALLLIATVLVGGLFNFLVGQLVAKSGLTVTDRVLGMLFGIARGVMIVAVVVLLAGLTRLPQDPLWRDALLLGHFQDMALWLRSFLPANIAESIRY